MVVVPLRTKQVHPLLLVPPSLVRMDKFLHICFLFLIYPRLLRRFYVCPQQRGVQVFHFSFTVRVGVGHNEKLLFLLRLLRLSSSFLESHSNR